MQAFTVLLGLLPILLQPVQQSKSDNYFPLDIGREWTYKLPTGTPGDQNEQTVRIAEYSQDYKAYLVRTIMRIGNELPVTSESFVEPRQSKILQLASRGGLFGSGWTFESRVLLQYPLKSGAKWKEGDKYETEYSVQGFVVLTVDAGTFKKVCKVKKSISLLGMNSFQYYAPGVGLIKEEVIGEDGGTDTFRELTEFKAQ